MRKILFIIAIIASIIALASVKNSFAQTGEGGEAGAFLKNGYGARASAMSNTFTAIANDVSSIFYNPAGLSSNQKLQFMGMYSNLYGNMNGVNYGNFGVSKGFQSGTFGLGVIYSKVSDIPYVTSLSGPDGSTFSDNETAFYLSYSRTVTENVRVGANLKLISHTLADASATGFGADIGVLAKFNEQFAGGLVLQDIVPPKISLGSRSDSYPGKIKLGIAYKVIPALTISPEMNYTFDKSVQFTGGAEYNVYKDIITLRGGYNSVSTSPSFGVGINYMDVHLDYSYNVNKDLGAVNKFGFVISLK